LAPLQKSILQLDTHTFITIPAPWMTMRTRSKKARKVDSSNDVNPDLQQEGEIPYLFNMEGEEKIDSYL
jgi:hypothetical protein